MSALWEITDDLAKLFLELEANYGELTPEIEARLERLNSDRAAKVQGIIRWCRMQRRYAEAQKEEAREFAMMAGRRERAAENLEAHLVAEMQRLGQKEIRCDAFAVSLARIGIPRIGADHIAEAEIPEIFARVVPEKRHFDKKAALNWLKSLSDLPAEAGRYKVIFAGVLFQGCEKPFIYSDESDLSSKEFTLEVRERLQVK